MFHDARRHVHRVTGADLLLVNLSAFALPLNDAAPAQDEVDLFEVRGILDLQTLCPVLVCVCQRCALKPGLTSSTLKKSLSVARTLLICPASALWPRMFCG